MACKYCYVGLDLGTHADRYYVLERTASGVVEAIVCDECVTDGYVSLCHKCQEIVDIPDLCLNQDRVDDFECAECAGDQWAYEAPNFVPNGSTLQRIAESVLGHNTYSSGNLWES